VSATSSKKPLLKKAVTQDSSSLYVVQPNGHSKGAVVKTTI